MIFFSTEHCGSNDFVTFYEAVRTHGTDKPTAVCKLLDIQKDTLQRYLTGKSDPPKAMVRLLFHETHFARQATDAHAHNGFVYQLRLTQSLNAEVERLKSTLAALEVENQELKQSNDQQIYAANSSRYRA